MISTGITSPIAIFMVVVGLVVAFAIYMIIDIIRSKKYHWQELQKARKNLADWCWLGALLGIVCYAIFFF